MAPKPLEPADYPDRIGPHLMRVEGDTLCVKFIGIYSVADARQLIGISDELYRQHGMSFLLADLADAAPPPPETRKLIAHWPFLGRYALAAYGVSLPIRAIIQLMNAARRLLAHSALDVQVAPDEPSARQLIAEWRRARQAKK